MPGLDPGRVFELVAEVERHDERDECFDGESMLIEPILGTRLREGVAEDPTPTLVDHLEVLAHRQVVPRHGLQLEPHLPVAAVVVVHVRHRCAPLVNEGDVPCIQRTLALEEAFAGDLQGFEEEAVERPEVVADEAVVDTRLGRNDPNRQCRIALFDQQPLGRLEEGAARVGR